MKPPILLNLEYLKEPIKVKGAGTKIKYIGRMKIIIQDDGLDYKKWDTECSILTVKNKGTKKQEEVMITMEALMDILIMLQNKVEDPTEV